MFSEGDRSFAAAAAGTMRWQWEHAALECWRSVAPPRTTAAQSERESLLPLPSVTRMFSRRACRIDGDGVLSVQVR